MHIIPRYSCARKETVDLDIHVRSRKSDRKKMQSFRTTSRSRSPTIKKEAEKVQPVQINTNKVLPIKNYLAKLRRRANSSREATRVGKTVLYTHLWSLSYISKYLLGASAQAWQQYFMQGHNDRFIEIMSNLWRKKLNRTNQDFNFLEAVLALALTSTRNLRKKVFSWCLWQ